MKYAGLLMLVLACTMAGRLFSSRLRNRVKTLEKFVLMLKLMQTEIEYVNMPTYEMLKNASERQELSDMDFIKECINMIDGGEPFSSAWEKSVKKFKLWELEGRDEEIIISFGRSLGTTDRDGQIQLCKMYGEMLQRKTDEARQNSERQSGMFSKIGLIIGVAVAVILI